MIPSTKKYIRRTKPVDEAYIDRDFAEVSYEEKVSMLRRLYEAVAFAPVFRRLPDHFKKIFSGYFKNWHSVTPSEIVKTISQLASLRSIPNYYLLDFTISMARDTIRMQFNCYGTHIVSSEDYQRFIEENR